MLFKGSLIVVLTSVILFVTIVYGGIRLMKFRGLFDVRTTEELAIWESQGDNVRDLSYSIQLSHMGPLTRFASIGKHLALQLTERDVWYRVQSEYWLSTQESTPTDTISIAVIIGESFIKSHSSLYGYRLLTNPGLQSEFDSGRLIVFSDMITPACFTRETMRNVLNLNSLSERKWWNNSLYFPMVFRRNGWEVSFYSNQFYPDDGEPGVSSFIFSPLMVDSVYSAYNHMIMEYDHEFIEKVKKEWRSEVFKKDVPKLEIWHLYGQHFRQRDRFPDEQRYKKWNSGDYQLPIPWLTEERKQQIADYDNATVYNDSVVMEIISLYRKEPSVVFYFSDHGEEMWDLVEAGSRNNLKPEDKAWLHRLFDIPFFVWCSAEFERRWPEKVRAIREAANKPGMSDNVGHMLLNIGGIDKPPYSAESDMLSPDWRPSERVTLHGYQYDSTEK